MTDLGDTPGLAEILKEIRDSIREQNALLKKMIPHQETLPSAAEHRQASPHVSPPASNDGAENESEVLNALQRYAVDHWPLLKDRVSFYRGTNEKFQGSFIDSKPIERELAATIEAAGPHPQKGVASASWKYWVPIFEQDTSHTSDTLLLGFHYGGGRPDYVPPWELRKVGDKLFHVDDLKNEEALPFSEDDIAKRVMIPYSLTPPAPAGYRVNSGIATRGITVDWNKLYDNFGDLYSVPPDGRVPLSFERNELRLKCTPPDGIGPYLADVRDLLERLEQKEGSFFVIDFDAFNGSAAYSKRNIKPEELKAMPSFWKAAGPAILNEERNLRVAPSRSVRLLDIPSFNAFAKRMRMDKLNAEDNVIRQPFTAGPFTRGPFTTDPFAQSVNTRNWYRLIHFRGLSSIIGSNTRNSPTFSADIEKIWSRLIYSSEERPRMTDENHATIREAFNLHLSCNRIQGSGNLFSTRWKPFHITWFKVLDDQPEEKFNSSS
ncbi:hypothetical protein F4677DRAFT_194033 [Hypoxylon crocopeplum]|nr:hypothetical protein F4677DRAFT_194033 [Hypoxylon crocopeplum]